MAITKTHPIKRTLRKAIDYICNPEKTDGKLLIYSYRCSAETADIEFEFTRKKAMQKGDNIARHLIQSFEPNEVSYEEAHAIGKQLADEVLQGKYEYVLTTHIDKGHIHNHIIFNSVDFETYHKYNSNKKSYYQIRSISDRLCKEHGLSVIEPSIEKGKSFKEYNANKNGASWKTKLKNEIDDCITKSSNFEEFLEQMKIAGYEIKHGKYISFRSIEQQRFTRAKTLGERYTEENIIARISEEKPKIIKQKPKIDNDKVNLIIDISNNVKAQESKGFEHWAKINNLKQMAKSVNFIGENNINSFQELQDKIIEMSKNHETILGEIKDVEKRIKELSTISKNIKNYNQTKPIFEKYQKSILKNKFYKENESKLIIFETSKNALTKAKIDVNLENTNSIISEINKLKLEKENLYNDYSKTKKEIRELNIIKQNFEIFLGEVDENSISNDDKIKFKKEEI